MSGDQTIVVVARFRVQPDAGTRVRALLLQLRDSSLTEPGCLGYEILSNDDPDVVVLLERYRDHAAVGAHRASTHYQALLVAQILPLLTSRQVELLTPHTPG